MSKRWTDKEDKFIHAYFDAIGDYIGPHDLGRPKGAAAKRAKFLKESGAWDALTRTNKAYNDYLRLTGYVFEGDFIEEQNSSELPSQASTDKPHGVPPPTPCGTPNPAGEP